MILAVLPGTEQVSAARWCLNRALLRQCWIEYSFMTPTFSLSRSKHPVLWKERERNTVCPTGLGVRRALQVKALKTQLLCPGLRQWVLPKPPGAAGNVMWKMLIWKHAAF